MLSNLRRSSSHSSRKVRMALNSCDIEQIMNKFVNGNVEKEGNTRRLCRLSLLRDLHEPVTLNQPDKVTEGQLANSSRPDCWLGVIYVSNRPILLVCVMQLVGGANKLHQWFTVSISRGKRLITKRHQVLLLISFGMFVFSFPM